MSDLYAGLPTLATEAFHGKIDEQQPAITEADIFDAEVESSLQDREDWEAEMAERDDEPPSDDDLPPSRSGFDVGDEDAIFGRGL